VALCAREEVAAVAAGRTTHSAGAEYCRRQSVK
jgi:hypothetical protein